MVLYNLQESISEPVYYVQPKCYVEDFGFLEFSGIFGSKSPPIVCSCSDSHCSFWTTNQSEIKKKGEGGGGLQILFF